jgi:hypothetical protein
MPTPATRPGSIRPPVKGWAGLWRLLIPAGALLVAAVYFGQRPSSPVEQTPSPAAVRDQAPSSAHEALILKPTQPPGQDAPSIVQDARFSMLDDGQTLRIDGGIGRQFARQLEAVLAEHRFLQRIIITSGGGYAGPGLEAGRMIQRHNLTVRVHSICASMCVGLWAAATARELEADALIGLHQWRLDCRPLGEDLRRECEYQGQFATEHDSTYTAWLRSAGFNAYLLSLQANTPAANVAVLTAPQLWDNGVDFNVVNADGQRMTPEQVQALLQDRRLHGNR